MVDINELKEKILISPDETKKQIVEFIHQGELSLQEVVKTFPHHDDIVKMVLVREAEEKLIDEMSRDAIDPSLAIAQHPTNKAIILAAYHKSPLSIQRARKDTIDELGASGLIEIDDVLSIWQKKMPTEDEKRQTEREFNEAMATGDWRMVSSICTHSFWFEKPAEANRESVVNILTKSQRWNNLYHFEKQSEEVYYTLTFGPLIKSPETADLENLARKIMTDSEFSVEEIHGDEYIVFPDKTKFNWTQIQLKADFQCIELTEDDYKILRPVCSSRFMSASDEELINYRKQLYTHPVTREPIPRPDNPISREEMDAIYLYTQSPSINRFMRHGNRLLDYVNQCRECRINYQPIISSYLARTLLIASGLRKLPILNIDESYREDVERTAEYQQKLVRAASKKEVLRFEGFISTTLSQDLKIFRSPGQIRYTLTNLRGAYIAPISQYPEQAEYLIPPTQMQILDYHYVEGQHRVNASVVSELGFKKEETFDLLEDSSLKFAHHRIVISLIEEGYIDPKRAIEIFSTHQDIVSACHRLAPMETRLSALVVSEDADFPSSKIASVAAMRESGSVSSVMVANEKLKATQGLSTSLFVNCEKNIQDMILKIKRSSLVGSKPNEQMIQSLLHMVVESKTEALLINLIKNDHDLCKLLDINPLKPASEIVADIELWIQRFKESLHRANPAL